jgi:protein SMG8
VSFFRAAKLKGSSKSMHFAKDVEKLITATEDLSLGPDENEFPALSVDHLSQVAADEHEDNMIEITGSIHEQPTISNRDFSTTEYLPCMLHVHSPIGILPRYSSWSLVCLGSSSLYSHNAGM